MQKSQIELCSDFYVYFFNHLQSLLSSSCDEVTERLPVAAALELGSFGSTWIYLNFVWNFSYVAWNDFETPNSWLEAVHSDLYVVLVTVWLDWPFSCVKIGSSSPEHLSICLTTSLPQDTPYHWLFVPGATP